MLLVGGVQIVGFVFKHKLEGIDAKTISLKELVESNQNTLGKFQEIPLLVTDIKKNEMNGYSYEFKVLEMSNIQSFRQENWIRWTISFKLSERNQLCLQQHFRLIFWSDLMISLSNRGRFQIKLKYFFPKTYWNFQKSLQKLTSDINECHLKSNDSFLDRSETIDSVKIKVKSFKILTLRQNQPMKSKLIYFWTLAETEFKKKRIHRAKPS